MYYTVWSGNISDGLRFRRSTVLSKARCLDQSNSLYPLTTTVHTKHTSRTRTNTCLSQELESSSEMIFTSRLFSWKLITFRTISTPIIFLFVIMFYPYGPPGSYLGSDSRTRSISLEDCPSLSKNILQLLTKVSTVWQWLYLDVHLTFSF